MLRFVSIAVCIAIANALHILPCEPGMAGPMGCDEFARNGGRLGGIHGGIGGVHGGIGGGNFIGTAGTLGTVGTVGTFGGSPGFINSFDSGIGNAGVLVDNFGDAGFAGGNIGIAGGKSLGISSGLGNIGIAGGKSIGISGGHLGLSSGLGKNIGLSSGFAKANLRGSSWGLGDLKGGQIGSIKTFVPRRQVVIGGLRRGSLGGY